MFFSINIPSSLKKSELWHAASEVIHVLREAGFSAWIVGGAPRDILCNRNPADLDIATSAVPDELLKLFPSAIPLGASFGVVVVVVRGLMFDVATYRYERAYEDGRHPEEVQYTDSPELDVYRRDFTINAMLLDPEQEQILDYTEGFADLKKGIVRTVGDPVRRFQEDHLRILRAVRFASRYRFRLEEKTEAAIRQMGDTLHKISRERIRDELEKILLGPDPSMGIRMLADLGLLAVILPELDELRGVEQSPVYHPEGDVFEHTMLMLDHLVSPSLELAWSVLLHDVGKKAVQTFDEQGIPHFYNHEYVGAEMAEKILTRLHLPRQTIETVVHAVRQHMRFSNVHQMREAKWKRMMGEKHFLMELELHRVDCLCSNGLLQNYRLMLQRLRQQGMQTVGQLPEPLLNGKQILACGIPSGPEIGRLLREIQDLQLEGHLKTAEDAVLFLQQKINQKKQ